MLIKKIILENFRQYNGKQEVSFSTDKEKNVTLIIGDNGTGKTTISQAFLWCLYGETPTFQKKESLLSKKAERGMYDGRNRLVTVTVFIEHNNKQYEIKRTQKYYLRNDKLLSEPSDLKIWITVNGQKDPETKKLDEIIREILPKELSEYFFLSGEKIDGMSTEIRAGKSKDFANAVNTLLGLDYFRDAIKHLTKISQQYSSASVGGFDVKIETVNRSIKDALTRRDEYEQKKNDQEKSKKYTEEQIIELKAKLKSVVSAKDLVANREVLEYKIGKAKISKNEETKRGIQNFFEKAPFYFASKKMQEMNEILENSIDIDDKDIPEKLHADLIDWIEQNGKCICGQEVKKGDEHYALLEKYRKIVPPESIGTLITRIKSTTNDKSRLGNGLREDLTMRRSTVSDKNEELDEFDDELKAINKKLLLAKDTSSDQEKLQMYERDFEASDSEIGELQQLLANIQLELAQKEKLRNKLLENDSEGRKILKWKKCTDELIQSFSKQLEEDENEKRVLLVAAVKKAFKEIYGESFSISVDNSYHISIDSGNEISSGQGMSVIFAFLAGLLNVIKSDDKGQNNGEALESYPLVLDAPFSVFDTTRISSICKVLPKVSGQIIVFIKDTDGKLAKKEMKEKIGKNYKLVKVNNSDEETEIREGE